MSDPTNVPLPHLDGWVLILGASSGFGAACSRKFAAAGCNIIGVHLDRRSTMGNVEALEKDIKDLGRESWFFNVNAADPEKRASVLDDVKARFTQRGKGESVRVLLHSLAFGTLRPLVSDADAMTQKQLEMTCDVMAHSLVYWVQDTLSRELMGEFGRIFAMTSTGSSEVWSGYGAVSAAKASLESHIRQLAMELAPRRITANAICAGVTETPAAAKIPGYDSIKATALRKNPYDRLTVPDDVGNALIALSQPSTYWLNGNVLYVDGGEAHCG
ncbi:MAG TPA: SDR family oxidoreductase [Polyangiaceae bacterium]|nr:SDR family oxidoreductase [Polyangiaceae bacterium]